MPFKKFEKNDIFYNKVKTFPQNTFTIYDSKVYHNNIKNDMQQFGTLHGTQQGFISLYELNVDRVIDNGGSDEPPAGTSIYPFLTKDGNRIAFKTISTSEFDSTSQFDHGDTIKGTYPLTSSIKRTRLAQTSLPVRDVSHGDVAGSYKQLQGNRKFIYSLQNSLNQYTYLSKHYEFSSSVNNWNKATQEISLVEIPSIFYGSSIRKGSVVLQVFVTGTLAAECRDIRKNGELIQVSGTYNASTNNDKVAGVVLYNEGFAILTGSWHLSQVTDTFHGDANQNPRWVDFAEGANEDSGPSAGTLEKVAFRMKFEGINYVPTITMMAHMPKGLYNNSSNPTAFQINSVKTAVSSSTVYREHEDLLFSKLNHSDYPDPTGSFEKQTYVSKIGIYDEHKKLIGFAKLANPIRKTENREYTFKLKMDF